MQQFYTLTRDVTPDEISVLVEPLKEGMVVGKYLGVTYGCIDENQEIACNVADVEGFVGLPLNALEKVQLF